MKNYYVYIITNSLKSTLYIGMTSDLERRMQEHKNGLIEGFSKKYSCVIPTEASEVKRNKRSGGI